MKKRTIAQSGLMLCLLLASGVGATSAIAARTIIVELAPPAQRVEVVPSDRRGHVWAPGHWAWRGGRHVWVEGHSIRARHGYNWSAPSWNERDGRHYFNEGRWDRNREGRDRGGRDRNERGRNERGRDQGRPYG